MCKYSVVIPCYNSGPWLSELTQRIADVFGTLDESFEVILVNDGSRDTTWQVIQEMADQFDFVHGIDLLFNTGQYRATLCGMEQARGRFVLTMDDDLQHPPEEIPKLIAVMEERTDLDCVLGKLTAKKHGLTRNLASRLVGYMFQVCYGKPSNLELSSFRLMTSQLADTLSLYSTVNPVVNSLILRSTPRIANADVIHQPRAQGVSGYSYAKLFQILIQNMLSVSTLPLKVISFIGLLTSAASFALGCYYLIRHLISPFGQPGFATLVLLLVFFGGLTLFSIGLLGEYVTSITEEVKGRPRYVIRRSVGGRVPGAEDSSGPSRQSHT